MTGLLVMSAVMLLAPPAFAQLSSNNMPPLSEYSIIEEKNLFHPDRIPQVPTSPMGVEPGFEESPPENFVLHGVILREEGRHIALLQEPTLTEKKVKSFVQGEHVGPYLLRTVKSDRVILTMGGREFVVSLYKKKEAQPAQRPPTPPSRLPIPRPRPRTAQ